MLVELFCLQRSNNWPFHPPEVTASPFISSVKLIDVLDTAGVKTETELKIQAVVRPAQTTTALPQQTHYTQAADQNTHMHTHTTWLLVVLDRKPSSHPARFHISQTSASGRSSATRKENMFKCQTAWMKGQKNRAQRGRNLSVLLIGSQMYQREKF